MEITYESIELMGRTVQLAISDAFVTVTSPDDDVTVMVDFEGEFGIAQPRNVQERASKLALQRLRETLQRGVRARRRKYRAR